MRRTFRDDDLQSALEQRGYCVLEDFLDASQVSALRDSYDRVGPAPSDPRLACHSSFHTHDREYKKRVDAEIRSVLTAPVRSALDRPRMLPCNFITKWPGAMSGFGLHQDLSLVDERLYRSVEVWAPLDEVDSDNGQLWMVPGSHDWIPTLRGIHAFPFAFGAVAERLVRQHAEPVPVSPGQAVVFNHATVHFSMPNTTESPRRVAITDVIPSEAEHLHYFGDGNGGVNTYAIGDDFWTDNSPFTLRKPPPHSSLVGRVQAAYRELGNEDLDALVAQGRAISTDDGPRGAINPAKPWCHRCGSLDLDGQPDRFIGNVTMLCQPCRRVEESRAVSVAHVSV